MNIIKLSGNLVNGVPSTSKESNTRSSFNDLTFVKFIFKDEYSQSFGISVIEVLLISNLSFIFRFFGSLLSYEYSAFKIPQVKLSGIVVI